MNQARRIPRSHVVNKGFTLLELIISMGLTVLLLSMLSAGIYAVVNDWQDETSGLDTSIDKALITLQIERALDAAFPHTYIDRERFQRFVYFIGSENEVRFVSTISPQRHLGLTTWQLVSSDEQGLQLKLAPALSDNPDARLEAVTAVSLLPNYEASFRYLIQRGRDEKEWLDQWSGDELQSLPLAVEVILTPINTALDTEVLEILAPLKANQQQDIEPRLPEF